MAESRQSSSKDSLSTATDFGHANDSKQDFFGSTADSEEYNHSRQKSFKDSISKASGDSDESFCEPCMNSSKWIAVEGYCRICQEYLCVNCLGVHKSQKMTRRHTILDKDQMPKGQLSNANQDLCVEVCKTHHLQIVKFYCPAHNEAGCVDCMTIHHTSCRKDRVQDMSDGFQATMEYKLVQEHLDKILNELEEMKEMLVDNLEDLDSAYDIIQSQVTSFRQQVNDYLDKMQTQILDEITTIKQKCETEMKQLIANNESMMSEIEHTLGKLQNDTDVNANSIFVITKQAMKKLVTMETEINRMELSRQEQQIEFVFEPSTLVQDLISDTTPLGTLEKTDFINTTAFYSGSINVKTTSDEHNCWITDCTLLTPDTMVAVDNMNKNIKLLDLRNNTILSNCCTPSAPEGVAAISTDQIAVTLPYDGKLQLYNITNTSTFRKLREIRVQNGCRTIAYKNGLFAVSYAFPSRASIEIMNAQGKVSHTMSIEGNIYNTTMLMPMYITFGRDKDTVLVSVPWSNEIKLLTFRGETLNTFQHDTLGSSHGIQLQENGYLFVCSSDCIHVISPDFRTSATMVRDHINIWRPTSIIYCARNRTLYISSTATKQNVIQLFKLKNPRYRKRDEIYLPYVLPKW